MIQRELLITPEEWTVQQIAECHSTNDVARDLPEWHAVQAEKQRAARGRFGRAWQSEVGGVWLSAVVPAPLNEPLWKMMPLAAGVAVATTIQNFGFSSVRLRWPNDVMVGTRKCAGILVDRFHADRCVVGIGVNLFNDPSLQDASLKNSSIRLAEVLTPCPSIDVFTQKLLKNLKSILRAMKIGGALELVRSLDHIWKIPTPVEVLVNDKNFFGIFYGVNHQGWVRLKFEDGLIEEFSPEDIQLMREI